MSGGFVAVALVSLLSLITGGLMCVARLDTEQLEAHLEYSWGFGRLFCVAAVFCLFAESAGPRPLLSMCAGGAAGSFAYHAACLLASSFRK